MVSNPDIFTNNILTLPGPSVTVKNPSARKLLHIFTELFDIKSKTAVRRVGADKSKRKEIRAGNMLWSSITKRMVHTKISERLKKYMYNWILQHPQVLQSTVDNGCLKLYIYGHSEPHLVPRFLLKVSAQEIPNIMVSPPEEGVLKEEIDSDNNITISDYTLISIMPPQRNHMYARYKVICGCECYTSTKNIHSLLISCHDPYLNKLKDLSQNSQNRRSGKMANSLFETYEK